MELAVVASCISRSAGGLYLSVSQMAKAISLLGVNCTVSGMRDKYTAEDLNQWVPLNVCVYSRRGPGFFSVSRSMRKAILKSKPDIVHTHGIWLYPSLIDLTAKRQMKTPYVVSPRGMLDSWALQNSAWKKKLAGWVYENRHLSRADCIHALCESEYRSIRSYGLKNPVAIMPNGIDLPNLEEEKKAIPPWGPQVDKDKKVMLFLGRIHSKKGLSNLVKAWPKAKPKDWILAIAGWDQGGHENQLKKLVAKLGLTEDVIFPGPVYDDLKQTCLQNVSAFILPSFSEGLPMSVLEAWSYNLPVIMTRQCNIPEGFEANAAIEIRPEPNSIVEGLKQFVELSSGEQNQIGRNGLKLVKEQFTWPKIASQMIGVYKWILGKGTKPECVRLS
jgi:poly(glycerol-phosphate) alpha-glucosyltransferase